MRWLFDRLVCSLVMLLLLTGCFTPQGKPPPPPQLTEPTAWPGGPERLDLWKKGEWFLSGANYPWLHYGHDFGVATPWTHDGVSSAKSTAQIDSEFSNMAKAGVHVIRWFVFGDGKASPEFSADGNVTGLDEYFFSDMDTALSLAKRHNIHLILVLLDFCIALSPDCGKKPFSAELPQEGGRATLFSKEKRGSFFEKALKPLLERYKTDPYILAWEVMNEPEGVMKIDDQESKQDNPVDQGVMQDFIKEAVGVIHAHSPKMVTVGAKSRKYLYLWTDSGLDLYQYHHYDRLEESGYPLDYPYSALNEKLQLQNKPTIVGEFPTNLSTPLRCQNEKHPTATKRTLTQHLNIILENKYAGGLAWSYGASDCYSDLSSKMSEYTTWLKNYEASIPLSSKPLLFDEISNQVQSPNQSE